MKFGRLYFCPPSRIIHLFNTGCKIHLKIFVKFATAGKNLAKVEFMSVEYYVSRGDTALSNGGWS